MDSSGKFLLETFQQVFARNVLANFCQNSSSKFLLEPFWQVFARTWCSNRKKHAVHYWWFIIDSSLHLILDQPPLHCQCGHNLRLRSEPLEAEAYFFHLVYHLFLTRKKFPCGYLLYWMLPQICHQSEPNVLLAVPTNLSEQYTFYSATHVNVSESDNQKASRNLHSLENFNCSTQRFQRLKRVLSPFLGD